MVLAQIVEAPPVVQSGPCLPCPSGGVVPPTYPTVLSAGDSAAAGLDVEAIPPALPAVAGTDGSSVSSSTGSDDAVCDVLDIGPTHIEGMCAWLCLMFVTFRYYNLHGTP